MYTGPFQYRYIDGDRNVDPRPFKVFDLSQKTEIASCFSEKDAKFVIDLMNHGAKISSLLEDLSDEDREREIKKLDEFLASNFGFAEFSEDAKKLFP
jgi:hypothetical protein